MFICNLSRVDDISAFNEIILRTSIIVLEDRLVFVYPRQIVLHSKIQVRRENENGTKLRNWTDRKRQRTYLDKNIEQIKLERERERERERGRETSADLNAAYPMCVLT